MRATWFGARSGRSLIMTGPDFSSMRRVFASLDAVSCGSSFRRYLYLFSFFSGVSPLSRPSLHETMWGQSYVADMGTREPDCYLFFFRAAQCFFRASAPWGVVNDDAPPPSEAISLTRREAIAWCSGAAIRN